MFRRAWYIIWGINSWKNIYQNIEEEIENINNSHEKITKEIISYFEQEYPKLNESEEKLKYELDLKVPEIKGWIRKIF